MNSLFETSKAFMVYYNIVSHVGGIHRKDTAAKRFYIFNVLY